MADSDPQERGSKQGEGTRTRFHRGEGCVERGEPQRAVWSVGSPRGLQSSSSGPRGTDQHTSVRKAFNPGKEPWEKNMKSNSRTHPGSGLHFHHLQWEGPTTHMTSEGWGALERVLPQGCCKIIPKLTVFWSNRLTELKGHPPREQTLPNNVSTPREKLKRIYRDTEISNTQCLARTQNY